MKHKTTSNGSTPLRGQRDFAKLPGGQSEVSTRKHNARQKNELPKKKKEKKRRPLWFRLTKWCLILSVSLFGLTFVGYWGLIFYYESRLPKIFAADDYVERTAQITRIYGADDEVLAEIGDERRSVVAEKDIPKLVKLAVLAAEDADFYEHAGLDFWGMARAMWKNVRDKRFSQGASTITQQVAKTFYLSSERTLSRKLKEIVLTRKLEQKLSKDEILYLYLNQIYWGHGCYGAKEASRFYFGKDLKSLTLSDAALLAGLIASPEHYTPFRDLTKATERRAYVLDQMAEHEFVSAGAAERAKHAPIRLNFRGNPHLGAAKYATATVRAFLIERFGSEMVRRGGLKVYTTIDSRLQQDAVDAVRRGLKDMDTRYGLGQAIERLGTAQIAHHTKVLKKRVSRRGIRSGEVVLGIVTKVDKKRKGYIVDAGLGPGLLPFSSVTRYAGGRAPDSLYQVGDVLRVSPRDAWAQPVPAGATLPTMNLDQGPQGALVAIDPRTREIKALVGGYTFVTHPFNRAAHGRRQAGSTFKPIVYGAAIASKTYNSTSKVLNVPESYRLPNGRFWKPRNFSNRYDGEAYTLRQSLAKSINVIAVKILEKTGLGPALAFARKVGIRSKIQRDLSIALGSTAVSPMEIANVYATFASGGKHARPFLVRRVEDANGKVLYESSVETKQAISAAVAYRITEMLRAVVESGTGRRARLPGRHVAGKTGTTDKGVDSWFVGYTPSLVTSVWVGFDDSRPVQKATGGRLAAPIWSRFMTAAHVGIPMARFRPPASVKPLPPMTTKRSKVSRAGHARKNGPERRTTPNGQIDLLYE